MNKERTPAQREASRRNGRLSRGPVTERGKSVSSMNAAKHGLLGREVLQPGESAEEFAAFRDEMAASLQPSSPMQLELINHMADASWRLRRFGAMEAELFNEGAIKYVEGARNEEEAEWRSQYALAGAFLNGGAKFELLGHDETRFHREFHRSLQAFLPNEPGKSLKNQ